MREGHRLRLTADHRLRKITRRTRWSCEWEWAEAGSFAPGDEALLHDHRGAPDWGTPEAAERDAAEGYLLGLLTGDGTLKSDMAVLSVWPGQRVVNGADERPGVRGMMDAATEAVRYFRHRADFKGWTEISGRGEWRRDHDPGEYTYRAQQQGHQRRLAEIKVHRRCRFSSAGWAAERTVAG